MRLNKAEVREKGGNAVIEPRHDRKSPRSWLGLFWAVRGWLALIAGVILLFLTFVSVKFYADGQRLAENGLWTQAIVVEKWVDRSGDNDSYHARFSYTVEGNTYLGDRNVGYSYYRQHSEGAAVDVKYWSKGPSLFEYKEGQLQNSARWMQVGALISGVFGCGLLWYSGTRVNSAVLSRRRGQRTTATVLGFVERKNSGRPTGRGFMIFETADGKRSESLDQDIKTLRALGRGSQIVVYVRGNDVWWEGDVGPRKTIESNIPRVM